MRASTVRTISSPNLKSGSTPRQSSYDLVLSGDNESVSSISIEISTSSRGSSTFGGSSCSTLSDFSSIGKHASTSWGVANGAGNDPLKSYGFRQNVARMQHGGRLGKPLPGGPAGIGGADRWGSNNRLDTLISKPSKGASIRPEVPRRRLSEHKRRLLSESTLLTGSETTQDSSDYVTSDEELDNKLFAGGLDEKFVDLKTCRDAPKLPTRSLRNLFEEDDGSKNGSSLGLSSVADASITPTHESLRKPVIPKSRRRSSMGGGVVPSMYLPDSQHEEEPQMSWTDFQNDGLSRSHRRSNREGEKRKSRRKIKRSSSLCVGAASSSLLDTADKLSKSHSPYMEKKRPSGKPRRRTSMCARNTSFSMLDREDSDDKMKGEKKNSSGKPRNPSSARVGRETVSSTLDLEKQDNGTKKAAVHKAIRRRSSIGVDCELKNSPPGVESTPVAPRHSRRRSSICGGEKMISPAEGAAESSKGDFQILRRRSSMAGITAAPVGDNGGQGAPDCLKGKVRSSRQSMH